ncbi:RDD family protein [Pseudomonas sp. NPDC078700]|uniref:RDD family protein n=1 Tax=Pseudomonas sp. NPDC078700 TaxID=3364424 RepID=UPI0037C76CA5
MPHTENHQQSATSQTSDHAIADLLDTRYHVETPEGIDLTLRPAGLVPRALAYSIDLIIRGVVLGLMYLLLSMLGKLGMGLGTILLFVVTWWYMVWFEVLNQGRSPGKQWMGLRVVHDDGTPVGWPASLTRNLLRFVDILPFGYTFGILCCLNSPTFKRLGDIAAGTLVVYRETKPLAPVLPEAQAVRAPFALNLKEQRAILGFAERASGLSKERRTELASIIAQPLQVPPEQAEQTLNGIAHSLVGPR